MLETEYLSQHVFIKLIEERKSVEKEMNHFCTCTSPIPASHSGYSSYLPARITSNIEQQAHGSQTRIKRPLNPFMVWSCEKRKIIAMKNPKMHNNDISKQLGEEWKNMPPEKKQKFIDKSKELREEHKKQYPHYKYCPRRKVKDLFESKELVPINYSNAHPNNSCVGFINRCRFYGILCSQCLMPIFVPTFPHYPNIQQPLQDSSLPLANHSATEPDATFGAINTGDQMMFSSDNQCYELQPQCYNSFSADRSL